MDSEFLAELEQRMVENKKLSQGGLPGFLAPVAYVIGVYTWQVLVVVSAMVVIMGYWWRPELMEWLVRSSLMMR